MNTKPYPQTEEKPMVLEEPAVAYQRTDPMTYRGTSQHPFTWDEARKWIAESEAEDADGTLAVDFFSELKREFPWLS